MFDFSNVASQEVSQDRTALFTFWKLEGRPVLRVKPATEANPAFMRAMLKAARAQAQRIRAGAVGPEILAEARERDRVLYPEHVVLDWPTPPMDAKRQPVQFSREACAAFLRAVPYDMFQELRDFCSDNDNFRPEGSMTPAEGEALGGN